MKNILLLISIFTLISISDVINAQNSPICSSFTNTSATIPTGLGHFMVNGVYGTGNAVFVATYYGMSFSTDFGATFTNKTTENGLGSNYIFDVYATGETYLSWFFAATANGLSISRDLGATFTNKTTTNGLGSNIVYGVYSESGGSLIYAATSNGLSISNNWAYSFTNKTTLEGLGDNRVNGVYVSGGTIYAATQGGLSISTDGGLTFINKTTVDGLGDDRVNGVYVSGGAIYAATQGGLSISTDGGVTFVNKTTLNGLGDNFVKRVYILYSKIYAATSAGLSISTDGGVTFTNKTFIDGLRSKQTTGVYAGLNKVFVSTAVGLAISNNYGSSFVNKMNTVPSNSGLGDDNVESIFIPQNTVQNRIYAATQGGLSISTDGGLTFINKTTVDGLGDDFVLDVFVKGDTIYAATPRGLSISTDGGNTFTNKTTLDGLGADYLKGVCVTENKVYVATAFGLSISTNRGISFTNVISTTGGGNYYNGVYATGNNVYAGTEMGGLRISSDGGLTFTDKTTLNGLGSNTVYRVYAIGTNVYAATNGGLSISSNGGTSFTNKTTSDGLGANKVKSVYVKDGKIYAATDGGLSISTDGGVTFTNYIVTSRYIGSNYVKSVYATDKSVYVGHYEGLSFGLLCKSINSSSENNGSISPSGTINLNSGASQTYTFTPNPGYWIDSVIVNGVKVPTASSYTFSNVSSNQSIRVTYRSLATALASANICANDTTVATVNLPATSLVRATTYYSNIYLFNQNNTNNAYKYNVNDRKYTAIADKPTPCIECGVAEANGKIFCFNTNGTTQAYDIASNTWQTQINQPSSSTSSVYAASINNKVYVLGTNANNQNTFTQYNPNNNTYTAQAIPNQATSQSRLVAYNNLIYKIGGINTTTNTTSTAVEVYNPSNNTWTNLPDLPEALSHVGATNYDNKLYVFGGKQSTASNSTNSNKVYVFDIAGNTWYAQSNTLNFQRANIEAKTANGLVYLFGGTDSSNTTTNQAMRYFCKDQLCTCKWAEYVCNGVSSDLPCSQLSPSIYSLSQDTTANTGSLYSGTAATNATITLNYTGANGANYNARSIASTGVTGLIATLASGTLNNGIGTLILNITGTPTTNGTASFTITIGGKTCVFKKNVNDKFMFGKGVSDIDNNFYSTLIIGNQEWMNQNLKCKRYSNGDTIKLIKNNIEWQLNGENNQPAVSYYNYDTALNFNYCMLYNWYSVSETRNICPNGWHVPNKNDWDLMISFLDTNMNKNLSPESAFVTSLTAGKILDSLNFIPNENGYRAIDQFYHGFSQAAFYSSSNDINGFGFIYVIGKPSINVLPEIKSHGYPVRCIKD